MPSIKKNLTLQISYQILSVCLPLVTAPYLARVLGPAPLGVFSYTLSVVGYFTLFAMLGTFNYGTRTIASVRDNKVLLNTNFRGVFALQVSSSLFSLGGYIVYLLFFCSENPWIAAIQGIMLLGCLGDISWLFFGLEDFTVTVTRSLVVRLLTLACILLFIKQPDDLYLYTLIMAGGTVLSQVILWFNLPKCIYFQFPTYQEIVSHIKPNLMLFFPLLAISVYHLMDKTMLGMLSTYEQTGFYYNADKVVNIPLAVLNAIGIVLLPRMSALTEAQNYQAADELFVQTICAVAAISVAMGMGIAAVAKDFVPLFFGPGYEPCVLLVYFFAPIFIIKSFSHISSTQFLIPRHQEKNLTQAVCLGAVANLICNIVLIPRYGALGAVVGTLVAELVSCAWQFKYVIASISLKKAFQQFIVYMGIGVIMCYIAQLVDPYISHCFSRMMVKILMGSVLYITGCMCYWKWTCNPLLGQLQDYGRSIRNKFVRSYLRFY